MTTIVTKGYVPDGEDRMQWFFEGEDWLPEEQQVLVDLVTEHVIHIRETYGFDITNYFRFSKSPFNFGDDPTEYLYFCQRCTWQWNIMAKSIDDLVQKVREYLEH